MSDELPEGWESVTLDDAGAWGSGGTPSRKVANYFGGGIPWVKSGDLPDGLLTSVEETISRAGLENSSAKLVPKGTVSIAMYGATIGRLAVLGIDAATNQACANCQPSDGLVDRWFLFYYLLSQREGFVGAGQGGAQPNISATILRDWPFPLAPLPEQHRIVAQVEALLEQANRARERLDRVPLILNRFRQAVLAAACSGRLTEDWRVQNAGWSDEAEDFKTKLTVAPRRKDLVEPAEAEHDVPDGWPIVSLAAIATHLTSGSRAWSPYYQDDGFGTFVMAQNVRPMRFDQSHRQGVAPPADDPERVRTTVQEGDILVTIVGANTGDVCRVGVPVKDHFVCQSVALARLAVPGFARFVELWLNSALHGQRLYQEWAYGEGRPHLSFDHLRSTPIAVPGLREQSEILRRVTDLLALADAIERRVQTATSRADKLPQAILSKAFAGELVPTEADIARVEGRTYETAAELLARIASETSGGFGAGSGRRAPKSGRASKRRAG